MRALCVAVALCAFAHGAWAQPDDAAQANALFLEGRELLTSGKTQAACAKFESSIALDPEAPGVMLNLGLCYERLEKFAASLYWFRKAQVAAAEAALPEYEDEAKRHTVDLAAKVSVVRIDASAAGDNVEVAIDSKVVAATDFARVEVDRGKHVLEAKATKKQTYRHAFTVRGPDAGTLTVPLLKDEPKPTPVVIERPEGPMRAPSNRNRIVLSATLAGVGAGLCIASPLWARKIKRDYDADVLAGRKPSYDGARNKQHVATGMFAAGLVLLAGAGYLYLTMPSGSPVSTVGIAPVIDGEQLGLAISGAL